MNDPPNIAPIRDVASEVCTESRLAAVSPRAVSPCIVFFFFNDTATTEIYTLSLHDALPISMGPKPADPAGHPSAWCRRAVPEDRKSTRLNSSHTVISYAVFCLKKKKKK